MKGLVWGPTFEIASEKLNNIKQDYLNLRYTIDKEIDNKH